MWCLTYEQNTYFRPLPTDTIESALPSSRKKRQTPLELGQDLNSCPFKPSNSLKAISDSESEKRALSFSSEDQEKTRNKNKNKNNYSNNIRIIISNLSNSYCSSQSLSDEQKAFAQKLLLDLLPFLEVVFRSSKTAEVLYYLMENKAATYQVLKRDTDIPYQTIFYCLNKLTELGILEYRLIEDPNPEIKYVGRIPKVYFVVDSTFTDIERAIDMHYRLMAVKRDERKERKLMLFRDQYIEQAKDRIIRGAEPAYVKNWLYQDKGFTSEEADKIVEGFVKEYRY